MDTSVAITLRFTEVERARYEGVARSAGQTLTRWIESALAYYAEERQTAPVDARARRRADGQPIGFTGGRDADTQ